MPLPAPTRSIRLAALFITAWIAGACDPVPPPAAHTAGGRDLREHGLSAEGLGRIQDMLDEAIRDGRIPSGLAAIAHEDEIVWLATAGEMGPGIPMRSDVIIPLASIGKMYTAVAVMILYERGVISLDDPVSRFIPEFAQVRVAIPAGSGRTRLVPPDRPITIQHLLTHAGGLQVTGDVFWAAWDASMSQTTTHLARRLAALPLQSHPGTMYAYGQTGASYEVLGAIIEIASGQTLEAFLTDHVFTPLGLHDTHFYLPAGKEARMPATWRRVDDTLRLDRPYGQDFPRSTFFHGGGGVEASPQDLVRFAQLFLNGGAVGDVRILRPETVRLMLTDHLGERSTLSRNRSWGFGATVRYTNQDTIPGAPSQYGWVGGGYARFWVDFPRRLAAYLMFPITPPGDNALLARFEELVDEAVVSSPSAGSP